MAGLIDVPCSRCGKQWSPSRKQFVAGLWRVCDDCRARLAADRTPATGDDPATDAGPPASASAAPAGRRGDGP